MVHVDDRENVDNDDEFYVQSLIGLEVVYTPADRPLDGVSIGTVVDVFDGFGTYDSLSIQVRPFHSLQRR